MARPKAARKRVDAAIEIYEISFEANEPDPIVLVCPSCTSGNAFDVIAEATFRYRFDADEEPRDRWSASQDAYLNRKNLTTCLDCGYEGPLFDFVYAGGSNENR